jgi:hypothetical protein
MDFELNLLEFVVPRYVKDLAVHPPLEADWTDEHILILEGWKVMGRSYICKKKKDFDEETKRGLPGDAF